MLLNSVSTKLGKVHYAKAIRWYLKSAEQGNADAQYRLGDMYHTCEGVTQDYVQAHMWFNLAESRFTAAEKESRDEAISNRDRLASKMTSAQIAETQKLARVEFPRLEFPRLRGQ